MLRANVGLSRKLSRDYNSTGFSVNLDGEICIPLDDPEAVVEKVKELFDLAEEALNRQVERYEGESAIASRDAEPPRDRPSGNGRDGNRNGPDRRGNGSQRPVANGHGGNGSSVGRGPDGPATEKQIKFLLGIAKRRRLSTVQLEAEVAEILGKAVGVYQLTKHEAGAVIHALNPKEADGRG